MKLNLKEEYGKTISLRENAREIISRANSKNIKIIDFSGVEFVSRSFAHEIVKKLPDEVKVTGRNKKVRLMMDIVEGQKRSMKTLNEHIEHYQQQEDYLEQRPLLAKKWRNKREALEEFKEEIKGIKDDNKKYEILQKHIQKHMNMSHKNASDKYKAVALYSYREQKREEAQADEP